MMPEKQKLMTVKEVAEYLQLDEHTVYRIARTGKLPAYKVAAQWRFRRELIDEWLEEQRNSGR